jgi:hypothetical protein
LILSQDQAPQLCLLLANLNCLVTEFVLRQKFNGLSLNYFYLKQIPILPPHEYEKLCGWNPVNTIRDWAYRHILELTYTAWDLEPFASDCSYNGPPFRWDDQRRFLLRCELDAGFFHLYGINRDDVEYILETFFILKRKDIEKHGTYRIKATILAVYDSMAEAIRSGVPYQTILDPPSGPPSDPLPEWISGQPKPANWPSHIHPPRGCRATPTDEWRLSDVADGAILPSSFKLVLEDHEAINSVERRWKCKTIADGDGLPEVDTWVLLRHPDLMRANKAIPVALGKLTYQELTDANTKQKVMVVTLRGPVPPAQVRIPLEDWPSFRPLAILEPLDS